MARSPLAILGKAVAHYLSRPDPRYQPVTTCLPDALAAALKPGDVLLVEGNTRFSKAIKFLTQSTWSHSALYIGSGAGLRDESGEPAVLIEADIERGVIAVPLNKYATMHTRICRPIGLTPEDVEGVIAAAVLRIGHTYDLKNVLDLVRYLLPQPPVPVRWRRRMLSLGSGEPTKAICSTLIAQIFEAVRYPVLPVIKAEAIPGVDQTACTNCTRDVFHIRHHSLYAPRDFDLSPYFQVVKPTIEQGFDYKQLAWAAS